MAPLVKLNDDELLSRLREGDEAAFTAIYQRYWPLLFRHARKLLQDEDEALDVVQDIFTELWKKSAFIGINSSLSAYLYTATRNKTASLFKRSKLKDSYLSSLTDFIEEGVYETDDRVRYNEFSATIEAEITRLPPKMRAIFELSRKDGLSYRQIAEELDISDETVRKQIYRALKTLRLKLSSFLFSMLF